LRNYTYKKVCAFEAERY